MISIYEAEKLCEGCRKILLEQDFRLEFSDGHAEPEFRSEE